VLPRSATFLGGFYFLPSSYGNDGKNVTFYVCSIAIVEVGDEIWNMEIIAETKEIKREKKYYGWFVLVTYVHHFV